MFLNYEYYIIVEPPFQVTLLKMANVFTEKGCIRDTESGELESSESSEDTTKSWAATQNPFAQKPTLKTDTVTSSHHHFSPAVHLAPSRFTSSRSESPTFVKESVLLPSRLGMLNKTEGAQSPSKCLLRPSVLSAQVQHLKQKDSETKEKENNESKENQAQDKEKEKCDDNTEPTAATNHAADSKEKSSSENYFAATLGSKDGETDSSTEQVKESEFIFGQNLNERVTGVKPSSSGSFLFGQNLADRVVKVDKGDDNSSADDGSDHEPHNDTDKVRTLEESAREFQAKHERKTEYQEIEVKTGEENESNVLQSSGKLFAFDAQNQNWNERGRGLLRLNDSGSPSHRSTEFQSRMVMRTHGSLKVILNTKIWSGMTVERASQKSVRITATDGDDGIKVFLIMTSQKDCENILRAVDWRIQQLRVLEESDDVKSGDKRKADTDDNNSDENTSKKVRGSSGEASLGLMSSCVKREESDSSVLDPETDVSSESCASSSLAVRSDTE